MTGARDTLTWESLKVTPQQKAKALMASRLALGANVLLELGEIDRARHTEILKILAADMVPVVNAMSRTLAAQVGRNPEGGDPKGLRAQHEHAVAEGDAPNSDRTTP